jgi:hypothetical protein
MQQSQQRKVVGIGMKKLPYELSRIERSLKMKEERRKKKKQRLVFLFLVLVMMESGKVSL